VIRNSIRRFPHLFHTFQFDNLLRHVVYLFGFLIAIIHHVKILTRTTHEKLSEQRNEQCFGFQTDEKRQEIKIYHNLPGGVLSGDI